MGHGASGLDISSIIFIISKNSQAQGNFSIIFDKNIAHEIGHFFGLPHSFYQVTNYSDFNHIANFSSYLNKNDLSKFKNELSGLENLSKFSNFHSDPLSGKKTEFEQLKTSQRLYLKQLIDITFSLKEIFVPINFSALNPDTTYAEVLKNWESIYSQKISLFAPLMTRMPEFLLRGVKPKNKKIVYNNCFWDEEKKEFWCNYNESPEGVNISVSAKNNKYLEGIFFKNGTIPNCMTYNFNPITGNCFFSSVQQKLIEINLDLPAYRKLKVYEN